MKPEGKENHRSTDWACLEPLPLRVSVILSVLLQEPKNAEPDACLGTWQATDTAVISRLDHDSALRCRQPPPEHSGQFKNSKAELILPAQAIGEVRQLLQAEPGASHRPSRPPSRCASQLGGKSRGVISHRTPHAEQKIQTSLEALLYSQGTEPFIGSD